MNNLSLVIPVYNEKENLKKLVEEIIESLDKKFVFEIIFVNDGSTDQSLEILNQIQKRYKNIYVHNIIKNKGQSFCIFKGVELSNFSTIVTLDADLQNDPKDIQNLANYYFHNYPKFKLVGGLRKKRKDSYLKIFSSKIANKVRKFILKDNCDDTGCSLKVFEKKEFLKLPYFNGIHRFLPALFIALNNKNYFLEVNHRFRIYGKSKYGTFGRLIRGIFDIAKVIKIKKNIKL